MHEAHKSTSSRTWLKTVSSLIWSAWLPTFVGSHGSRRHCHAGALSALLHNFLKVHQFIRHLSVVQVKTGEQVDPQDSLIMATAADVWSSGVVFFRILTNSMPFMACDSSQWAPTCVTGAAERKQWGMRNSLFQSQRSWVGALACISDPVQSNLGRAHDCTASKLPSAHYQELINLAFVI